MFLSVVQIWIVLSLSLGAIWCVFVWISSRLRPGEAEASDPSDHPPDTPTTAPNRTTASAYPKETRAQS